MAIAFIWSFSVPSSAQEGVKVVPIGQTIKPESTGRVKKKRRYRAPVVKEGSTFIVVLGTALSSGLTKEGETITIRSTEDVGSSSKYPGIKMGAAGRGTVSQVDQKGGKLSVRFDTIESYNGTPVAISGNIQLEGKGKKSAAMASVGERYTATVNEKIVVKRVRKKKKKNGEPEILTGFIEVSGKGSKVDLKKGKSKGKIKMVLEGPKGYTADDIDTNTVKLISVNGNDLANPVRPTAQKPKQGDANKNGTSDWSLAFGSWDFIKNQPKGMNTIIVSGLLRNGQEFNATTRVKIDY